MKKVCLVKGGNFVLGIEARYILSRQHGMLPQETAGKAGEIFHLGSLLARKPCNRPEPGSVFLQLHKGEKTFFLLVDQIIDEIELPEQTTRLPPPSPELAEQLCPQVAVCMNLVVLLLDPGQVIPVARQLGRGVGLVAPEHCFQEKTSGPLEHTEQQLKNSGPAALNGQIRKDKKRPKSVDEETFKRVMAWTIAQFKQGKVGAEHLAADRLPPGLVRQEGVSDTVIQYLIDQISLRCQESITPTRSGEHHGG
ncbi:MAG: hypothetical protein D3914_09910 [Candidatus Electrothrix sp. LOE2]|nr:hypothetical protein [Candidatus Electrothrix sp. LOE2]